MSPSFTQLQIRRLFQGQPTAPCYWCGKILWPKEATRDHKLPRTDGGGSAIANLVLACGPCNNFRGDILFDDYEEMWKQLRAGALSTEEFTKLVHVKRQARQYSRTGDSPRPPRVKRPPRLSCALCRKEGCNPGNHKITWMHDEYCPWCWAMKCTPEVHVEGLKSIEQ